MKTLKYIIWGILVFLWVFYIVPVGLLKVPYVQEKISEKASEVLQEKLGVETKIGRVDFELFNKLILKDLYLKDQAGDTLFQAKRLAAGFEFSPLFKGRLRFNTVQLFSFQLNLNKETTDAPLNLQFVLDAFAKKDTTNKNPDIDLQIQTLNLRRGNFSYHVKDAGTTPGKFNSKDIRIKDLSAKIHIQSLTNRELIANFSRFSFYEKSGLNVQRVSFDIMATNHKAEIKKLELKLPQSSLSLKNITADYSNVEYPEEYVSRTLLNMQIEPSGIHLNDLAALIPVFGNFKDKITIEGLLNGSLDDMRLENFYIQESDRLMVQANTELKNLSNSNEIYLRGAIEQSFISTDGIQRMANNFSNTPVELPSQVINLGTVRFVGEISGYIHHLTAYGIINTDIGTIRTDLNIGQDGNLSVKGSVKSSGMNFKKLMNDDNYGNTSFSIEVDAKQDNNKKFSGKIDANIGRFDYKGYSYENMNMKGLFTPSSFSGNVGIESPEGYLAAEGLFILKGKNSEFNFSADARHIKLDRLNLSRKYKESDLSFEVNANFSGNSIDNLMGSINLTNMRFSTEKGGYYLDTLSINATQLETEKLLAVHSDIANGEIRGIYSFTGIVTSVKQTLSNYLPAFFPPSKKPNELNPNSFSLNFTVEDTQEFSEIMDLPFVLYDKTNIVGQYNSIYDKFRIEVNSPKFSYKKSVIESGAIFLENPKDYIQLQVSGISFQKKGRKMKFSSTVTAANDKLNTQFNWDTSDNNKYTGTLAFNALFNKPDKLSPLEADINILPTKIVLNDSIWQIHAASLNIDSKTVKVNKLRVDHEDQYIQIDGIIARNPQETLKIDLNKVNLEYVFRTLNIPALEFKGIATGYVHAQDIYTTRKLSTKLNVNNFAFNNTVFGNLALEGLWDEQQQGILMRGNVIKDDTTHVGVDGIIYPVKEELSIVFDAHNADASFLRKYTSKVAKDVSGKLSGKLRLFGNLNKPTVEGDVYVRNGRFGIEFLNTYYTFSDTVRCRPTEILVKDMNLYDRNGWAALIKNGSVKHQLFDNFRYSIDFAYDNFLLFDAPERLNPLFHGTVYGTGTAKINGTESVVNIEVSMQNTKNTKLALNFMNENDISSYDFIRFIDKKEDTTSLVDKYFSLLNQKPIYMNAGTDTDIRFKLNLDATPEAQVDLIMDPSTGDKIRTFGRGHLEVEYGTRTPLRMIGKYAIERGKYNFSFQQVLFRDFDIREGSSVSFQGDPYTANINIDAVYTTMANLSDLNPELVTYAGRSSVPVNCVLGITGAMEHPNIKFNIEIPESEYLDRQIKNYINTEDMMNRQIVYLLVLNRFYTTAPQYLNTSASRINDFSSIASSTLSSSLSSIMSSFTENVQLGTRIRAADDVAMTGNEVELMLSSQLLNNRLIINGNFGYRDYSGISGYDEKELPPFIGDFDLEYRLAPGGNTWLKFYSHYNYRYYYENKAKTTQGLGIIYRKNFERMDELFGKKRQPFQLPPLLPADTIIGLPTDSLKIRTDLNVETGK